MFSLQTIFGKGDKFYGLLEASAESAHSSASALIELLSTPATQQSLEKFAERYTLAVGRIGDVDFTSRAVMLEQACEVLEQITGLLRKGMDLDQIKKLNDQLQTIEAEADRQILELYRDAYNNETDPIRYLVKMDLFEILEKAIDRCRDAGNVIYHIALKNS